MKKNSIRNQCLIMCTTPLQMIIAEQLINTNPHKNFNILLVTPNHNSKYNYYFNRISSKCNMSIYYVTPKSSLLTLLTFHSGFVKAIKQTILSLTYDEIYLASIDSRHFQYIVTKNPTSILFTFDDGTANIINTSIYYSYNRVRALKQYPWRCLGVKNDMEDLKSLSSLHFTIYKGVKNIIDKTQFIPLIDQNKTVRNKPENQSLERSKVVNIYLGQPLHEISKVYSVENIQSKLSQINIDIYFPHPREGAHTPKGQFKVVDSPLIFEDFIIDYLYNNPTIRVNVYSFISSALLNVSHIPNINPIYIYDPYLQIRFKSFYELAENYFKIDFITLS